MRLDKREPPMDLIVGLVEGPARHEDANHEEVLSPFTFQRSTYFSTFPLFHFSTFPVVSRIRPEGASHAITVVGGHAGPRVWRGGNRSDAQLDTHADSRRPDRYRRRVGL